MVIVRTYGGVFRHTIVLRLPSKIKNISSASRVYMSKIILPGLATAVPPVRLHRRGQKTAKT